MLALAALVFVGAIEGFSQTPASSSPPAPKFEVASIRANKSGDVNRRITIPSPESFTATNITVRLLIEDAYRHPSGRMRREYEIVGWPDWTETEGFDVTAKSSTPVQDSQLRAMLQALLVDRFHLKLHTETRDLPTYALALNRADGGFGPQLQKSTGECQPFVGRGAAPAASPVKPGQTLRACGFSGGRGPGQINAVNVTMTQFANALANQVDREVADRTGLTGTFDLRLQFMPQRRLALATVALPDAPSIFTAVREQLGLRLDNERAPADVLVIDSVERPTEN